MSIEAADRKIDNDGARNWLVLPGGELRQGRLTAAQLCDDGHADAEEVADPLLPDEIAQAQALRSDNDDGLQSIDVGAAAPVRVLFRCAHPSSAEHKCQRNTLAEEMVWCMRRGHPSPV